jgi:hypothetical protein
VEEYPHGYWMDRMYNGKHIWRQRQYACNTIEGHYLLKNEDLIRYFVVYDIDREQNPY